MLRKCRVIYDLINSAPNRSMVESRLGVPLITTKSVEEFVRKMR
jgi:hypothetical protein